GAALAAAAAAAIGGLPVALWPPTRPRAEQPAPLAAAGAVLDTAAEQADDHPSGRQAGATGTAAQHAQTVAEPPRRRHGPDDRARVHAPGLAVVARICRAGRGGVAGVVVATPTLPPARAPHPLDAPAVARA